MIRLERLIEACADDASYSFGQKVLKGLEEMMRVIRVVSFIGTGGEEASDSFG